MLRSFSRPLGVALVLALATGASAQTTLRYKFQEGDKTEYVSENKVKTTSNVGGINIMMNLDQTIYMTWTVEKVNKDGAAALKIKVDRMVMTVEAPPPIGAATIDSNEKKDPDNILAQQFSKLVRAMAGSEITATMAPTGEFSDVKMPKELDKGFKDLTGGLGVSGGIEQLVGGGLTLPKDAVEKGKTWTSKNEAKTAMGNLNVEMKYTYEGADGDLEKITVIPKMNMEGKGAGPTLKSDDKKSKGTVLFDNRAGRIAEMRTTQVMSGTVEMMGFAINMDLDVTTTLKAKGRK